MKPDIGEVYLTQSRRTMDLQTRHSGHFIPLRERTVLCYHQVDTGTVPIPPPADRKLQAFRALLPAWNNHDNKENANYCQLNESSLYSLSENGHQVTKPEPAPVRVRGRPSSTLIESLKQQSPYSRFWCKICNRSFPRKKSLDAHILVHDNLRPFTCDFPGCGKSFRQSGQLKTHTRIHTKEKPYQCGSKGCDQKFTHANRRCWLHRDVPLKRICCNSVDVDQICNTLVDEELSKMTKRDCQFPDRDILQKRIREWLSRNLGNFGTASQSKVDKENGCHNDTEVESISQESDYWVVSSEQQRQMEGALALMELLNG